MHKVEADTRAEMALRWHHSDFDFFKGCDVGAYVFIELGKLADAKTLVLRALTIKPSAPRCRGGCAGSTTDYNTN